MRTAAIVSLLCVAAAVSGCNTYSGHSVEFVSSNPDSVLLDFNGKPTGELSAANEAAVQQCHIFTNRTAVLESLNVRDGDTIRATYLCKGGSMSADAGTTSTMRRRQ
jgi:hypothetical protein